MTFNSFRRLLLQLACAMPLSVALLPVAAHAQDYSALVAAPDRVEADRAQDAKRKPAQLLAFAGPKEGWKVLDLGAGAGYSTELMARAVGPNGRVFGQSDKASEKLAARVNALSLKNITPLVRSFEDPAPADQRDLDLVTFFNAYHDTTHMEVDRAKMNKAIFAALKPGGFFVLVDHSAKPEDGVSVGKTLHRIAEKSLRAEVEAAGFKFVGDADFWKHPEDARDAPVSRNPTPVDEFAVKFQKPM
ncbi:MAG: methyltransferase [Hyphomicrobiales bacterium]|nr:methyltransferase [Hyphomicrobiales bacterium]